MITDEEIKQAYADFMAAEKKSTLAHARHRGLYLKIEDSTKAIRAELDGAPPAVIARNITSRLATDIALLRTLEEEMIKCRDGAKMAAIQVDMLNHRLLLSDIVSRC